MTIDRDELVGRAVREVVDTTPPPPSFEDLMAFRAPPPARPSRALTLAVAAAAVVLVGVGLVLTRDRSSDPTGVGAIGPPPVLARPADPLDRLLYPDASAQARVTWSQVGPDLSERAAGALVSPAGNLFRLYASENYWVSLSPDMATRVVNGSTFGVDNEDGTRAYTTLNECTMAGVADRSSDPIEWSEEPMQLLAGFALQDRDVTLRLPPGWTSLGTGSQGLPYMLQFDAKVNGVTREVSVSQLLDAPVGVVADGRGRATSLDVAGAPGWYLDGDGGAIAWSAGDVAVLVRVRDGNLDDLLAAAALLSPGHGREWAALVGQTDPTAAGTTAAPVTSSCGSHHVTVVP